MRVTMNIDGKTYDVDTRDLEHYSTLVGDAADSLRKASAVYEEVKRQSARPSLMLATGAAAEHVNGNGHGRLQIPQDTRAQETMNGLLQQMHASLGQIAGASQRLIDAAKSKGTGEKD